MRAIAFLLLIALLQAVLGNVWSDNQHLTSYSEGDAKTFAVVSAAAYCSDGAGAKVKNWSCGHCKASGLAMSDVTIINVKSTNTWGLVGLGKKGSATRIVVAFTGTRFTSITNWATNLSFAKTAYSGCSGCEVHSGFLKAYQGARPQVVAAVQALVKKYGNIPVIITGHSLGGALAAHCLADFKSGVFTVTQLGSASYVSNGNPDYDEEFTVSPYAMKLLGGVEAKYTPTLAATHYNYGQPRVGNKAFADWYRQKLGSYGLYRVVHWRDLVPHLPTKAMGFHHAVTEIWYNDKNTKATVCSGTDGEDKNCSAGLLITTSVADHLEYVGYKFKHDSTSC